MTSPKQCSEMCWRQVTCLIVLVAQILPLSGCSRQFWRRQADRDSYNAIDEKLNNPHWQLPRINLTPDTRSRFHDPWQPDFEPLPPDDPAAHQFMHCVNGRRGYKNWHKLGQALSIENPQWLEPFGIEVPAGDPVAGHAEVKLLQVTLPQAVELAYIHSREYQTAIEELYLSALDLTLERFRLGVRYLVGGREPGTNLTSTTLRDGTTAGRLDSTFGVSQILPTGGQIAVELANSTLWLFGSPGSSSATSLSYSLTQPLLFAAGRKIALEPLTQAERDVLYQARNLARFRQLLFTRITRDYLILLLQAQSIVNTENNIRQLQVQLDAQDARDSQAPGLLHDPLDEFPEGVVIPEELRQQLSYRDGFLGWVGEMSELQREQLLRLSDDDGWQVAVNQIIDWKEGRVVSLNTAQLRTRLNNQQSRLFNTRRQLADQLDAFKITLGLPPNIELQIDESMLVPFELISTDLITLETRLRTLQTELGAVLLPEETADGGAVVQLEDLQRYLQELAEARDRLEFVGLRQLEQDVIPVREILELTADDWQAVHAGVRYFSSPEERERVAADLQRDLNLFRMSAGDFRQYSDRLQMLVDLLQVETINDLTTKLDASGNGLIELSELPEEWSKLPRIGNKKLEDARLPEAVLQEARDGAFSLREKFLRITQSLEVTQAGLRVERIALNRFMLNSTADTPSIEEVIRIGLENRHDLMNARARVMDQRRRVEIAANRLEAALDVTIEGSTGLSRQNEDLSRYQAGLKFTTPLDQIVERNAYKAALIEYQRERRAYMLLEDQIKQDIRENWRQIQVQQDRLEIDRQTIRNAALQYDNASLTAQGAAQTNALNLLNALQSVLDAVNALIADWNTSETSRLNIFADMGIMEIDQRGLWSDRFYQEMDSGSAESEPPAPPADSLPADSETEMDTDDVSTE